jgi:two-component system, cell cycle sensor histidine kinase and response regulator CckA
MISFKIDTVRKSIFKKFTVILAGCVILITSAWSCGMYVVNHRNLYSSLGNYSDQTAQRLAASLALPVWNLDKEGIDRIILIELKDENLIAVSYNDFQSEYFFEKNDTPPYYSVNNSFIDEKIFDKSFIVAKRDIVTIDKQQIGSVQLYITDAPVQKRIFWNLLSLIFQTLLIIGIIVVVLIQLFKKNFFVKISAINNGISEIANGNYRAKIDIGGTDELSNIAKNIQYMSETIQDREKHLFKLQKFLSNIIESMPSVLMSIDHDGSIIQWNKAAENTFLITSDDAIGKKLWALLPGFDKYAGILQKTIESNTPSMMTNEEYGRENIRRFNISLFPLVENGDRGVVVRLDDMTEIFKRDEQLRQAQKLEMVGTLAGGLAHDFNNVLSGIMGTASLLQYILETQGTIGNDEMQSDLDLILESTRRAADIVQQLLIISRKQEINFVPVDMNLSVKHIVKICTNTFDKIVQIDITLYDSPSVIFADPGQIEQVLLNVFINGYHAMTIMRKEDEVQGGKLLVTVDKLKADSHFHKTHPESAEDKLYYRVTVRDSGVGMEPEIISRIFDPFFTTKTKDKGTGLGLAMVYNIVAQHNGFIDVYSEVGQGSTFNLYFPVLESSKENGELDHAEDIKKGSGLILIIDDEKIIRQTASAILEECGYTVVLASDGEEGVEIFRQRHSEISAVLLDLIMPKLSGKETFSKLKEIDPGVRVVLASGFRQDNRIDSLIREGILVFLQKPYTLKKLSHAIHQVTSMEK